MPSPSPTCAAAPPIRVAPPSRSAFIFHYSHRRLTPPATIVPDTHDPNRAFADGLAWMVMSILIDIDRAPRHLRSHLRTPPRRRPHRPRRLTAFAAVYSWVFKLALSIAAGLAGPLVVWAGFKAVVHLQTEPTLTAMRIAVPAVCILGAIDALRFYELVPARITQVRAELEARQGKV